MRVRSQRRRGYRRHSAGQELCENCLYYDESNKNPAKYKAYMHHPFGNTGDRWVYLCEDCAEDWVDDEGNPPIPISGRRGYRRHNAAFQDLETQDWETRYREARKIFKYVRDNKRCPICDRPLFVYEEYGVGGFIENESVGCPCGLRISPADGIYKIPKGKGAALRHNSAFQAEVLDKLDRVLQITGPDDELETMILEMSDEEAEDVLDEILRDNRVDKAAHKRG